MSFHLNLSLMHPGQVRTAWRLPERDPLAWIDVERYRGLARIAERARIHAVFLGDSPGLGTGIAGHPEAGLEPTVLFSTLLAGAEGLGAIATASSTYNEPYNIARRFLALDHVTGGRAAFNVVTTFAPAAAAAFGLDGNPATADRYRRADEFLRVVLGLWDGWDDGAIVGDRERGVFADLKRIHHVAHAGEALRVRGALSVPPSPQRRPVLVQAGGSPGGLAIGARWADVIFTAGQDLQEAADFRRETKERAAAYGRDPSQIVTSLGVVVVVEPTEREARARLEALVDSIDLPSAVLGVAAQLGLEPDRIDADTLLTPELLASATRPPASAGFHRSTVGLVASSRVTVRELIARSGGGGGHRVIAGTPESIADDLQRWHGAGAADGFTVMPADTGVDFEHFAEQVVPVLQRRGAFQLEYRGATLRENLGLDALVPGADRVRAAQPELATAQ